MHARKRASKRNTPSRKRAFRMIGRGPNTIPPTTVEQLLVSLRARRLLPAQQLAQLDAVCAKTELQPSELGQALLEQHLLTSYQVEQVLAGYCQELVLGQYRILDRLGSGGMGHVYKAEHLLMKRIVALKIVTVPEGEAGKTAVEQFHREVQALAQLSHPNIVTAFDAAEADGVHFLVMEYVEGRDLGRTVAELGPLPVHLACECIRQAAVGLQYAHERGLVHRDIKPANLLLRDGMNGSSADSAFQVKILDLGLARLAGLDPHSDPDNDLEGTPDFLAPELAHDCRTADIRGDLYSLGCTFYYLLSGQAPFPGGTWTEKVLRHRLDQPVSLQELRPELPEIVVGIVERLMAKDPQERYALPGIVAADLEAWLATQENDWKRRSLPHAAHQTDTPIPLTSFSWPGLDCQDEIDAASAPALPQMIHSDPEFFVHVPPTSSVQRKSMAWLKPVLICASLAVGVALAWLLPEHRIPAESTNAKPSAPIVRVGPSFWIEGSGKVVDTLPEAIAAAKDGDRIVIRASGVLSVRPMVLHDKALTLQASPGQRPILQLESVADNEAWQPLISTNRALTLKGLELRLDGAEHSGPAHLLYCEGESLSLNNCKIVAPTCTAPIVCRCVSQLEVRGCQLDADGLALSIEVGSAARTMIRLIDNTVHTHSTNGAALSVWSSAQRPSGMVGIHFEGNQIHAGRIAALTSLNNTVTIEASRNDFTFRQALLSFAGYPGTEAWRRGTVWHGGDNRYHGSPDWLMLEGNPAGVHGLAEWRTLWSQPERRSLARTSLSASQSSESSVPMDD